MDQTLYRDLHWKYLQGEYIVLNGKIDGVFLGRSLHRSVARIAREVPTNCFSRTIGLTHKSQYLYLQ